MTPVTRNQQPQALCLSPGLLPAVASQLEALPCFSGVATKRLITIAQSKLRNKKEIADRLTAMLVIVGATPLTDEVFMLTPTSNEREIGG